MATIRHLTSAGCNRRSLLLRHGFPAAYPVMGNVLWVLSRAGIKLSFAAPFAGCGVRRYQAVELLSPSPLYTDSPWLISPSRGSHRLEGRAAVRQHFAALPPGMAIHATTEAAEVHGDVAMAIGPWEITDAEGRLGEGYIVLVLHREGYEWRIHREIYNYTWRRGG